MVTLPGRLLETAGIVDQQVEAAEFGADALGGRGNRGGVGHVDLDGNGPCPDGLGGGFAFFGVARAEQDGDAIGDEFPGELEADALIGPGDEGDACISHDGILFALLCGQWRHDGLY